MSKRAASVFFLALAGFFGRGSAAPSSDGRPLALVGASVFDGTGKPPIPDATILVEGGRVRAVGRRTEVKVPEGAEVVDLAGKFVIPGLIDGHVHFFQSSGLYARPDFLEVPDHPYAKTVESIRKNPAPYLSAYLRAGVTSVVDFGGFSWIFDLRDRSDADPGSPRIAASGPLLGTMVIGKLQLDGEPIWDLADEEGGRALIERLAPRKPDLVKIHFILRPDRPFPAMRKAVAAAIEAAHGKGLRVGVHATQLETARAAVEAGADALVHSVDDRPVDVEFLKLCKERGTIYCPTIVALDSYRRVARGEWTADAFDRATSPAGEADTFERWKALKPDEIHGWASRMKDAPDAVPLMQRNLLAVHKAGITVAAATDAGNTGTLHGASLHRELALMVAAGLTPTETLVCATRNGARLMGREKDLGTLEPGTLADLVVLDADPLKEIANAKKIRLVMKGGTVVHRAAGG
ncbi:MAG TPA: amidohydrolase family protein [Planctomycetota bacterium]|jgi:imidazolonepropionase-like amidohydrolase|nr:amidohydrolase family protein [Planctomycetota bacterium]